MKSYSLPHLIEYGDVARLTRYYWGGNTEAWGYTECCPPPEYDEEDDID